MSLYSLDIQWKNRTDTKLLLIKEQVNAELDEMIKGHQEERKRIEELNRLVTAELFPKVDALVRECCAEIEALDPEKKRKRCKHCMGMVDGGEDFNDEDNEDTLTYQLAQRILELLPEQVRWYCDQYEFGAGEMIEECMNDDTIMILKLYKWCGELPPYSQAWDQLIPAYLARDVKTLRGLDG
jgi:hypothetical protein